MNIKKLAASACAAGVMTAGLFVVEPASAAATWVRVYNHSLSVGAIVAYNGGITRTIYPGGYGDITDSGGNARVDVDLGGQGGDVDSWKKKDVLAADYGPCYNNEDESSNPYSDHTGQGTLYRTYGWTGC